MYPDWPKFDSDLVPLPECPGPKLKPFDFHGPQQIEFLDKIGEGLHSYVFKVRILGQIYALKVVGIMPFLLPCLEIFLLTRGRSAVPLGMGW